MKRLRKCLSCGIYTLKQKCPKCNTASNIAAPMKFSPEDKYGSYRRKAKKDGLVKWGLL